MRRIILSLMLLMTLISCSRKETSERSIIQIDGSSTVFLITEAIAEEFQKINSNIKVIVGISGTGGGFKKFSRGEIDIVNASRLIKSSEVGLCKENGIDYIELPVAMDGLCIVVNPKNSWCSTMTVTDLKKIWAPESQGKITQWNHIRSGWPSQKLNLFGPGIDSGTYDYFTETIVGEEGSSRGDFTSSEDDNVIVQGIATDVGGLGFLGLAYYEQNKEHLKLLGIDNGINTVFPTSETIKNSIYQPLSRPLFIYVNTKSVNKPEIKSFIKFYLKNAEILVKEVGYVPLSEEMYKGIPVHLYEKTTD